MYIIKTFSVILDICSLENKIEKKTAHKYKPEHPKSHKLLMWEREREREMSVYHKVQFIYAIPSVDDLGTAAHLWQFSLFFFFQLFFSLKFQQKSQFVTSEKLT